MTLLVLGWKPRLEQILPDLGIDVVAVLGDAERRNFGQVPRSVARVIDLPDRADVGRLLPALSRLGYGPGTIKHIYTDQETPIVPAAMLAAHYNATGMSVPTAILARDKYLQKRAVAAAGIPVTRHHLVEGDAERREQVLRQLSYPAVVKPISGAASRQVRVVPDADAAVAAVATIDPGLPDADAFVVEGVVEGAERHADGIVVDGRVTFLSVSRYHTNVLAARSSATVGSAIIDPAGAPAHYARARALTQAVVEALGLRAGVFHLEYFVTADGLVFSECGARTGGTWVTDAVREKFAFDLRRASVEIAVGRPPSETPRTDQRAIGWSYLPAPGGRLVDLPAEAEVAALPGVRRVQVKRGLIGTVADNPRNCGLVLVEAADDAELDNRLAETLAWFRDKVQSTVA